MRIRIVCYEDIDAWILGKFAKRLRDELHAAGLQVDIAKTPDADAQVNHHIIYLDRKQRAGTVDTTMVTHVDEIGKVRLLRAMTDLDAAICMSQQTVDELATQGIPRSRLIAIQPAHDGVMVPRPLIFGITSKVHSDGRKREGMLLELAAALRPEEAQFRIMGDGWESQVAELRRRGFGVDYQPQFEPTAYRELIQSLDYFCYFGMDEGSMGFLDAVAAGAKTLVTAQGFHLDLPGGLTHPFTNAAELQSQVQAIIHDRRQRLSAVSEWSWKVYAQRHAALWEHLLAQPAGQRTVPDQQKKALGLMQRSRLQMRLLAGSLRTRAKRRSR